ncbi:MAG TPA: hypothetical protein VFM17_05420, partial [Candidatus Eisenbacteria bacterium]|nr:hypothetical protein [Candidatus Eisenbacteria bacterium]
MGRHRSSALAAALALASCVAPARGLESPRPSGALERAESLVRIGSFDSGAALLRDLVSTDPGNRRAKELLAFALESMGEIEGERRIRSALAAEHPRDPRLLADLGRVLERSGEDRDALNAYRRARALGASVPTRELEAAIERTRGRIATEIAAPFVVLSDPDATAWRGQGGAAFPIRARTHVAALSARAEAKGKSRPGRASSDM